MVEPLKHTDCLRFLLVVENKSVVVNLIARLERSLSDPVWRHDRIQYLLETGGREAPTQTHGNGTYKMAIAKMSCVAILGLSQAFGDGLVSAKEIGEMADDVPTIRRLADELLDAQGRGDLAEVWASAFILPEGVLDGCSADLKKIRG